MSGSISARPSGAQFVEGMDSVNHRTSMLLQRASRPPLRGARVPRPDRRRRRARMTGSTPVTSITVDGIAWQLTPVERGDNSREDLGRHIREAASVGLAGQVRARRDDSPEATDDLCRRPAEEQGRALRSTPGRPSVSQANRPLRVRHNEGERPGQERPDDRGLATVELGDELENRSDAREQHRGRLDGVPALEPVEVDSRLTVEGSAHETVDRVRRQHREPPSPDLLDDPVDVVHGNRPSTTRSMPARSGVIATPRRTRARRAAPRSARPVPPPLRARAHLRAQARSPLRDATASTAPSALSARAAPSRAPRAASPGRSAASTYGGFETTSSHGPTGRPSNRS